MEAGPHIGDCLLWAAAALGPGARGLDRRERDVLDKSLSEDSAELEGPRNLLRIRPGIFDFEQDLAQTKSHIFGTVATNRHTMTPNDYGPISACFDDDPKL